MSFCQHCGSSVDQQSAFCSNCGKHPSGLGLSISSTPAASASGVAAAPASEKSFHSSPGVLVTNSRFVVGPQTFAMSGVTSVRSFCEAPSHKGPLIVIGLGVLFVLGGLASGSQGIPAFVFGAILVAGGIWWLQSRKPTFYVILRTAATEVKALHSQDEGHIMDIVKALNDAIIHRQ